jgi:hypothetical protein
MLKLEKQGQQWLVIGSTLFIALSVSGEKKVYTILELIVTVMEARDIKGTRAT